jgi:hypothetical protein
MVISPEFACARGLTLGKEFTVCFDVGNDKIPPRLEAAYALDQSGKAVLKLLPEETGPLKQENSRWESSYRIRLDFSEPVDTADLANRLVTEPALPLKMETPPLYGTEYGMEYGSNYGIEYGSNYGIEYGSNYGIEYGTEYGAAYAGRVVFVFVQKAEYASSFLLRLNSGVRDAAGNQSSQPVVFRVRADGPCSKPPDFIGIRMPMAPGNSADNEVLSFSVETPFLNLPINAGENRYPYEVSIPTWIELYFDLAPGADIDLLSLMNLFRVETTNNALFFSPRSMDAGDFSLPPKPPAWEGYGRVKVTGTLTNTVDSGVVIFQIAPGLRDSLGNRNEKAVKIPLLK